MTEQLTDAMISAGASKLAEMCGHDEEPRGWDKDAARAIYLAMEAAKPSTPIDDEGLVEKVARALQTTTLNDGEGNSCYLFDILDFSGENKSRIVTRQLACIAIEAIRASNVS